MRTTLLACVLVLGVIVQNVREQKLEKAAIEELTEPRLLVVNQDF